MIIIENIDNCIAAEALKKAAHNPFSKIFVITATAKDEYLSSGHGLNKTIADKIGLFTYYNKLDIDNNISEHYFAAETSIKDNLSVCSFVGKNSHSERFFKEDYVKINLKETLRKTIFNKCSAKSLVTNYESVEIIMPEFMLPNDLILYLQGLIIETDFLEAHEYYKNNKVPLKLTICHYDKAETNVSFQNIATSDSSNITDNDNYNYTDDEIDYGFYNNKINLEKNVGFSATLKMTGLSGIPVTNGNIIYEDKKDSYVRFSTYPYGLFMYDDNGHTIYGYKIKDKKLVYNISTGEELCYEDMTNLSIIPLEINIISS